MTAGIPEQYQVVSLDTTESTNTVAKQYAADGCNNFTLVIAREQTGGRGRYDRKWISPRGNMYWSVVLRPEQTWPLLETISFFTAVAVGHTIDRFVRDESRIRFKWPNDVLLDERKVSGILIESTGTIRRNKNSVERAEIEDNCQWLVVGVGINVMHFPENALYPATSLKETLGLDVPVEEVTAAFSEDFLTLLGVWIEKGFSPIRKLFLARMKGLGEQIRVRLADREFTGTMLELDTDGRLVLDQGSTRQLISAGDVFFLQR
jgi:birA, biotin-[acetyl-CoA-carboxylase] ligase region